MVFSRTIVVLTGILGTIAHCNAVVPSLGTEIVIAKYKEAGEKIFDNGPHTGHGISPFISKFIQKGTNIFFKPNFMLSSAHISPPVQTMIVENENCVETPIVPAPLIPPPIIMDEPIVPVPVIIEKPLEPVMIPEAPVLPPLTLPVPTLPVVDCEEEIIVPHPLPFIPMPMPPVPVVIEEPPAPLVIPEAPVLPPLSLPALPLPVLNDCDEMVVPIAPELPLVPMVPPPVIVAEPPVVIPEAPVLPPLTLPNFPVPVMVEEHIECDDKIIHEPLVIPTAPVVEIPMQPMHFPTLPLMHHSLTQHIAVVREKIERVNGVVMPQLPVVDPVLSFPAECVQNIITERILPNMLNPHFEVVPAVPSYPVPSPYLPPLIKMF